MEYVAVANAGEKAAGKTLGKAGMVLVEAGLPSRYLTCRVDLLRRRR